MSLANQPERKRGRPAGKNRQPYSAEQRRARNAELERERRAEQAAAYAELAAAAGCEPGANTTEVLAAAITMISELIRGPRICDLEKDVARLKGVVKRTKKHLKAVPAGRRIEDVDEPDAEIHNTRKKIKLSAPDDAVASRSSGFPSMVPNTIETSQINKIASDRQPVIKFPSTQIIPTGHDQHSRLISYETPPYDKEGQEEFIETWPMNAEDSQGHVPPNIIDFQSEGPGFQLLTENDMRLLREYGCLDD